MLKINNKFCPFYLFLIYISVSFSFAQEFKTKNETDQLIHFGDLIEVDIIGGNDFDWRGTLNPEGFLDGIEFVDEPIYALCQDEKTVAAQIVKGYSKILRNPQVVVKILDKSGRAVSYLYGAVKFPQRFQITRPVRLNELLILSGGLDERASGEIQLLRTNSLNCLENNNKNTDKKAETLNVKDDLQGTKLLKINVLEMLKGYEESNPIILNGDIITVSEAEPIYVVGGVENPRKINARTEMTITRAISSAGGFAKNANLKNIVIYRRNKSETQVIEVDFDKIKNDAAEDIVLKKFDILEIGVNGEEKKRFSPYVKIIETQNKPLELPLRIVE